MNEISALWKYMIIRFLWWALPIEYLVCLRIDRHLNSLQTGLWWTNKLYFDVLFIVTRHSIALQRSLSCHPSLARPHSCIMQTTHFLCLLVIIGVIAVKGENIPLSVALSAHTHWVYRRARRRHTPRHEFRYRRHVRGDRSRWPRTWRRSRVYTRLRGRTPSYIGGPRTALHPASDLISSGAFDGWVEREYNEWVIFQFYQIVSSLITSISRWIMDGI